MSRFEEDVYIVGVDTGEIFLQVDENESINIRSPKQQENDKYYSPRKRIKGGFLKCMNAEQKVLEALKDNKQAFYALSVLKWHLKFNENIVVKADDKRYTVQDLANEIGVSRQMANNYIKALKDINVVSMYDYRGKMYLAINPYIYFLGDSPTERLQKHFSK